MLETFYWKVYFVGRIHMGHVKLSHTKLRDLLREPGEPFRHMAPSTPSTAPLGLSVCNHNGSTWSYTTDTLYIGDKGNHVGKPFGHIAPFWLGGATNGSPTLARLITEQWLLLWSQNDSFSFMCVLIKQLNKIVDSRLRRLFGKL